MILSVTTMPSSFVFPAAVDFSTTDTERNPRAMGPDRRLRLGGFSRYQG
jgi:hypothetical protein